MCGPHVTGGANDSDVLRARNLASVRSPGLKFSSPSIFTLTPPVCAPSWSTHRLQVPCSTWRRLCNRWSACRPPSPATRRRQMLLRQHRHHHLRVVAHASDRPLPAPPLRVAKRLDSVAAPTLDHHRPATRLCLATSTASVHASEHVSLRDGSAGMQMEKGKPANP